MALFAKGFLLIAFLLTLTPKTAIGVGTNSTSSDDSTTNSRWWAAPEPIIEAHSLSPCYRHIDYHIFDRNRGRLDVVADQTAQFSLSLNQTSIGNNDEDCSVIWVRVLVEPITLESAALVDSETDIFSSTVVFSRVVDIHRSARFPVRLYARGLFLGYSAIYFQGLPINKNSSLSSRNASQIPDSKNWVTFRSGKIATHRAHRPIDTTFQGLIFVLIICGNIGIGLNINWKEIRDILRRPIGPAIGFCCQYIVMPLTGFTATRLIDLPSNVALGVFLIGCAPGGGGSNMHSYFLGGSLPLSVTMTFVSTIAAVGMMPLWIFTLGRIVLNETESGIKLDVRGILFALINSIVPFVIGIVIHWKRPALAKRIFRVFIRPLLVFIFVYMITMGTFTNLYLFRLMQPKVLMAGVMLPYTGFILGFIIALLCRQTLSYAVTIAIETGIQSIGIALTTLFLSLPQPDADIAISGPLAVAMFTPIPLWLSEILRCVYLCIKRGRCFIFDSCRECLNKRFFDNDNDDDDDEEEEEEDHKNERDTTIGQSGIIIKISRETELTVLGRQISASLVPFAGSVAVIAEPSSAIKDEQETTATSSLISQQEDPLPTSSVESLYADAE